MRDKFHLEDKVSSLGGGIDSNQEPEPSPLENIEPAVQLEIPSSQEGRPKRSTTRPVYLNEFV